MALARPLAAAATASLAALLAPGRPLVMGILNVTPDSFSDGGRFVDPSVAVARARTMIVQGADILDVGAESTRPYGSTAISADEELRRLKPVLPEIIALGVPVSIDSMKADVTDWALRIGAAIANDVWGLQRDPEMARVVAAHGAPVVIMHNRVRADANIDIMQDIAAFFTRSTLRATSSVPAAAWPALPEISRVAADCRPPASRACSGSWHTTRTPPGAGPKRTGRPTTRSATTRMREWFM